MKKLTMSEAFASVLRRRRLALGFSQELLAEKANLHPNHVGLIERGLRNPSLKVLESIAIAFNCPLSELVIEAEKLTKKA